MEPHISNWSSWRNLLQCYHVWKTEQKITQPRSATTSYSYCCAFSQSGSYCSQYIHVDGSGNAQISIPASNMAAMHVGGNPNPTGNPVTQNPTRNTGQPTTHKIGPTTSPPEGMRQTVIFLDLQTQVGQDLFIRGGIGQSSPYGSKRSNKKNDTRSWVQRDFSTNCAIIY